MKKRLLAGLLCLLLVCTMLPLPTLAAEAATSVDVVFTHDLHSHVDSYADGSGGFARIKTIMDRFDKSRTLVLDAGDFSMGTLYQFGYTDYATELRLFGQMGYDATTFGNHEFDYGDDAAAEMLTTAFTSGDALPAFLYGNIDLALDYAGDTAVLADTLSTYAQQTLLVEKNGVTVGIFALMGDDSISCAPTSGLTWLEQADYAAEMVAQLEDAGADLIVCISHGGTSTDPASSEDELLAQAVDGIDLIVSGHSHTRLDQPITVNGTTIASCGEYGQRVGTLTLTQNDDGSWACSAYELVAVDSSVEPDEEIAAQITEIKEDILNPYLQTLGFSDIDQVVAYNTEDYLDLNSMYAELAEQPLGNLIADAYIYGVQQAEGDDYVPVDVAVVPVGIVRYAFPAGDVTVGACFETCALGYGTDGSPGYPLATVYLTGKELKALAEVDTSVSALMPAAQLYMTGLQYTYNPHRMFLNRVSEIQLVRADGSTEDLVDDQLYRVVGELYSTQMLGAVKASSYGLVSLEPKFADGTAVEDFWDCVVHDETGAEVKEWASLANYLLSLSENGDVAVLDESYHETQGRKVEDTSLSPVALLKNANKFTYILLAAVVLVVLIVVLVVRAVVRLVRRGKRKKGAAS